MPTSSLSNRCEGERAEEICRENDGREGEDDEITHSNSLAVALFPSIKSMEYGVCRELRRIVENRRENGALTTKHCYQQKFLSLHHLLFLYSFRMDESKSNFHSELTAVVG